MSAQAIIADRWLSDMLGYPVFRLEAGTSGSPDALASLVREHAAGQPRAMYFTRLATSDIARVRRLGAEGMFVADTSVTLALPPNHPAPPAPAGIAVRDCEPADVDAVLDIAGSCFRYSRFHADPLIPQATAHALKRAWIESYVERRRGERLLVASLDGRPAGFLAVLRSDDGGRIVRTIDLVGVAGAAQGRGVGKALVSAFIHRCGPGAGELRVGTQASNIPSLRLYEAFGFSIVSTSYMLHLHTGADTACA